MTTTRVGSLTVELTTDAAGFATRAEPLFAADPVGTSVVASWTERALRAALPVEARWMVVDTAQGPLGAAMHTPPHPPYLPPMPAPAAAALADALHEAGSSLPGVNGDAAATAAFAERWTALAGGRCRRTTEEGVHLLGSLVLPLGVAGRPRIAGLADVDLAMDWFRRFGAEIGAHQPPPQEALVQSRVRDGLLVLWTDSAGEPVSMAGWSRRRVPARPGCRGRAGDALHGPGEPDLERGVRTARLPPGRRRLGVAVRGARRVGVGRPCRASPGIPPTVGGRGAGWGQARGEATPR